MSVAIFTEPNDHEQVYELLCYFQNKGECEKIDFSESEWHKTLKELIENMSVLFADNVPDNDAGGIMNSIVSLVILMPLDIQTQFVDTLCKQMEKYAESSDKKRRMKHAALNTLFQGVTANELKFRCFDSLLNEEINSEKKHLVTLKLKEISQWLEEWCVEKPVIQDTLRKLRRIFLDRSDKAHSTESMMMLLRSFSIEDADSARADAIQCVVDALQDPGSLTMDQMLDLPPVQRLKGDAVFDLLTIFVSGSLADYQKFLASNPDFMVHNSLNEVVCLNKMRVLALMQLAASPDTTELEYSAIEAELQLAPEELESFIIEAVRQQAISCKLDQLQQKVVVAGAVPRQFGRKQWETLGADLELWSDNFTNIILDLEKLKVAGDN